MRNQGRVGEIVRRKIVTPTAMHSPENPLMASRDRVEAPGDKCGFLNAFHATSPSSDLADCCFWSQTIGRFQRETPVGYHGIPRPSLPTSHCNSLNESLLFPMNVNSGEFCRTKRGEKLHKPRGASPGEKGRAWSEPALFSEVCRKAH